jgi:DNA invertase Pin-like site-specific DNA recombinase
MGKCFFNILATFAEFEVDLLRMRAAKEWRLRAPKADSKGHPLAVASCDGHGLGVHALRSFGVDSTSSRLSQV